MEELEQKLQEKEQDLILAAQVGTQLLEEIDRVISF